MVYQTNERSRRGGGPQERRRRRQRLTRNPPPSPRPLEINEETRWKARVFSTEEPAEESDEIREARLLLALLNKLTPTKFERHVVRYLDQCQIYHSSSRLREAVTCIVHRGGEDARFASLYAQLCGRLATDLPSSSTDELNIKDSGGDEVVSFRKILRQVCWEEMQRDPTTRQLGPETDSVTERKWRLALEKSRYVGHYQFIGELFNHGAIDVAFMVQNIEWLLRTTSAATLPLEREISLMRLEGLCVQLETCGPKVEKESAAADVLERCWDRIKALVQTSSEGQEGGEVCLHHLCFRMRFLLLDLLEYRATGWEATRLVKQRRKLVAATLDQIHDLAEKEGSLNGKSRKKVHFKKIPPSDQR